MDKQFWIDKWAANEIGFHEPKGNALLVKHLDALGLKKNSRLFLPLCGKTLDIAWLLSQGFRIVGIELIEMAVEQLFSQLKVKPDISNLGRLKCYSAGNIDIYVGDIFELDQTVLGPVDAIYDRAALVALPHNMRRRYVQHVMAITDTAPQLLNCLEYDQNKMDGPPFSISEAEVRRHYQDDYQITLLESSDIEGGLKGKCPATENAWHLIPKS